MVRKGFKPRSVADGRDPSHITLREKWATRCFGSALLRAPVQPSSCSLSPGTGSYSGQQRDVFVLDFSGMQPPF
jgi:hypothetical protein